MPTTLGGGGSWGGNPKQFAPGNLSQINQIFAIDALARQMQDQYGQQVQDYTTGTGSYSTGGSGGSGGGSGGGGGGSVPAANPYQSQIDQINQLLGTYDAKKAQGIGSIETGWKTNRDDLKLNEARAYRDYDKNKVDNDKSRQKGIEDVDSFVNTSYGNLQRVLQRGNAGNSSVGKFLVPQLVSQAGGQRRQGVFETAGENEANIATARKDAEQDYGRAYSRLDTEKQSQIGDFLTGLNQSKADLLSQKLSYEQQAGQDTAGTQAALNARMSELSSLFGKYTPKYTQQNVTANKVNLGKYQVDPAQLKLDQNLPAESRYYSPQIKKKQELA
jgi:hypothetical protein